MFREAPSYTARRTPLFARNIVATSQPLAVQAGIAVMRRGGNAVDAALATAIALTVVEPNNNGLGSDAFAQVWDGETLHGINGSGRAPMAWSAERFAGRDRMPLLGWDSVTVPGAVNTWKMLSNRFGRLPFADLFGDAIRYARDGFQVGPFTAFYWKLAVQYMKNYPGFMAHFAPTGRAPNAGELFRRPEMAKSLERIADTEGEDFYRGEIAEAMVQCAEDEGGALTIEDLAAHQSNWVAPIGQDYGRVTLHEIPPNGQGLAAQIALAILNRFDLKALPPDSAESVHLQIEAMKIAIRAAFDHFADPAAMTLAPEDLLSPAAIDHAADSISPSRAAQTVHAHLPVSHDTVYLATADEEGCMVSFIQSNYFGFGSGIVIPGTGIALQNRGNGFSLAPGHPNEVAGGKQPFHTIIPGFVTEANEPRLSFGVMGGHMQHQGHVQMTHRIFDLYEDPQAASDAPRWHVFEDMTIGLENGFPKKVARQLEEFGHAVRFVDETHVFGGAQAICRLEDGYCAGSDHRKEGQAAGF